MEAWHWTSSEIRDTPLVDLFDLLGERKLRHAEGLRELPAMSTADFRKFARGRQEKPG